MILFAAFTVFVYTQYDLTMERFLYTTDMALTLAPISAKSAIRNFQDETRMDLYESSPGVMSSTYSGYLSWLGGKSAYSEIATDLHEKFGDGVNPSNYALPYLDKDKLTEEFNELYRQQLTGIANNSYVDIVGVTGTVKSMSRNINNFSAYGVMWGLGSSFYDNTSGHIMSYDYSNYVTYSVIFEVEVIINIDYGITNINAGMRQIVHDFEILYELVN